LSICIGCHADDLVNNHLMVPKSEVSLRGRPTVNKGWEFISGKAVKGKLFHIKIPWPILVRIKLDCYVDKDVLGDIKPTTTRPIKANYEDKEIIMKNLKKQGIDVIDIEQMTFGPIIDWCPKCGNRGIPSIQKKNTDQRYVKVNDEYNINLEGKVVSVPKPKTYWLSYRHKAKRCWVRQWEGARERTFKQPRKSESIHPRKFMIAGQIEELEKIKI